MIHITIIVDLLYENVCLLIKVSFDSNQFKSAFRFRSIDWHIMSC